MGIRWNWAVAVMLGGAIGVLVASLTAWAGVSSHHYRIQQGDVVSVPALHWTCLMSRASSRPVFTCNTDSKPITAVTVFRTTVIVDTNAKPVAIHGGYRFSYK